MSEDRYDPRDQPNHIDGLNFGPKKDKKRTIINAPPTGQDSALDSIQARAVGGRVAVIERGAKEATVIEVVEKKKESKRHTEITLDETTIEILQELQDELTALDLEIGRNTRLFTSMLKKLNEKADSVDETLKLQVRRLLKKHKAPEGWRVDLKNNKIVPPPMQQPQIIMRSPGAGNKKNEKNN